MEKAEERFRIIFYKFKSSKIPIKLFDKLTLFRTFEETKSLGVKLLMHFLIPIVIWMLVREMYLIHTSECIVEIPGDASKIFRAPEYCAFCKSFSKVDKVANVSREEFLEKYLKRNHPVVITDGALNWPALNIFTFDFFKEVFTSKVKQRRSDEDCQFFPYKTEFKSLEDVLNMDKDRAMLKPGTKPWYVGWKNCNDEVGRYLTQFYDRPYFLSNMTENTPLSWIFMGGPGPGAHMHVDDVTYPSWQVQLTGKKLWKLAPPPECYYKCDEVTVVVEPGEIIVLDTNRWYHQTEILPGDISVTIVSEFD